MPRWETKLPDEELKRRKAARDKKYQAENKEKIRNQKKEYWARRGLDLKYYHREWYLKHRKLKRKKEE